MYATLLVSSWFQDRLVQVSAMPPYMVSAWVSAMVSADELGYTAVSLGHAILKFQLQQLPRYQVLPWYYTSNCTRAQ